MEISNEKKTQKHIKKKLLTPPRMITASFALMIAVGAGLLSLPAASADGHSTSFADALFTATSASCVIGFEVVDTADHWSLLGKLIIALLMQLGALGLITILSITIIMLGRRLSLTDRLMIQASYNLSSIGGMGRLVRFVVTSTLAIEAVGAVIFTVLLLLAPNNYSFGRALSLGVFHSISSFCNAGFTLFEGSSLEAFRSQFWFNGATAVLVVLGGLGFPVLREFWLMATTRREQPFRIRLLHLSLHSKMAISITIFLTVTAAAAAMLLEWNNPATLGSFAAGEKAGLALFQSVMLRTAGFTNTDFTAQTEVTQFVSSLFMMVGGSSAGTAGGIKTVTVGIIFFAVLSLLKGENKIEAFGRTIPLDLLQKALTVTFTMGAVVFTSAFILYFTEQSGSSSHTFWQLIFECTSAASTVGISSGITASLTPLGKLVIIFCMFVGRLSPVTVVVALTMRLTKARGTSYPEERVIIG